jgi:hypothetical protein
MTMDQLDAFNRLHDRLSAYGDLLFGAERIDLADGTLTILGDLILETAQAASVLMNEVEEQNLPADKAGARKVREARASYCSLSGLTPTLDAAQLRWPSPVRTGLSPYAATCH